MGQSQSANAKKGDITSELSPRETQKLHDIIAQDKDGSTNITSEQCINNLTLHFAKHISSDLANVLGTTFHERYMRSKTKVDMEHYLILEIAKLTYGTQETLVQHVFEVMQKLSNPVNPSNFNMFLTNILQCLTKHPTANVFGVPSKSCERFIKELSESTKQDLRIEDLTNIFQSSPNLSDLCQYAFKAVLYENLENPVGDIEGFMPTLIPSLEIPGKFALNQDNTLLGLPDVIFLNSNLPLEHQHKWRFLYSTTVQGESFSKLSTQIMHQGPLLLVIRDREGHVFGGFISTNLTHSSQFQGDHKTFLFSIVPSLSIYSSTGYNDHYVYMNIGQETIPNGLGMGGQHDYFGLWLSTEFGKGHSRAKPKSTTFGSPQLSFNEDFLVDAVEAWAVGKEPTQEEDEMEEGQSVIDKNPDAVAILRIAGKERVSEGLRDSEATSALPEATELHPPHDPMEYP